MVKQGFYNLWKLEKEEQLHLSKVQELKRRNRQLIREVERLRNDPEYIEAIIKRELRMIREDEFIVYMEK